MILTSIVGVLGLYGTFMLADNGAYTSGKMMFIHDMLLNRQVDMDLYRFRGWYETESNQTMEAYCRQRNIWVKVEGYDLDTDEFLGEWTNEDYVDKTNDLTYRLESRVQHSGDNTYISTDNSQMTYGPAANVTESPAVYEDDSKTGDNGLTIAPADEDTAAAEAEAIENQDAEGYLNLGESVTLSGETYVPLERAVTYAELLIQKARKETDAAKDDTEKTLEERNLRIVVTLTVDPELTKEDEYALIYHQAEDFITVAM